MATDFEYLAEVAQGSSLHQTYKELRDECKRLLALTPAPNSPTSADHVKQLGVLWLYLQAIFNYNIISPSKWLSDFSIVVFVKFCITFGEFCIMQSINHDYTIALIL